MNSQTKKSAWLLLRGLGRDQRHWGDFPELLRKTFPRDDIVCLDLPGTGHFSKIKSPSSIGEIVDWLRLHNQTLLQKAPFNIIAISMGGMIAADWMDRFPNEIRSCVMINTSSRLNAVFQRINPLAAMHLLSIAIFSMEKREAAMANWVCNDRSRQIVLAREWIEYQQEKTVSLVSILRHLIAAAQFHPPKVFQPTLLLGSTEDRLVNIECTKTLANYWQTPVKIHPHAGHDLPYEDSGWVIQEIKQWNDETHST